MTPHLHIQSWAMNAAPGADAATAWQAVVAGDRTAMKTSDVWSPGHIKMIGESAATIPDLPLTAPVWQSRNNALLWQAAQQILPDIDRMISQYGRGRIAIILGTSTAGIREGEQALETRSKTGNYPAGYDYAIQEMHAPSWFLQEALALTGPCMTISTACSSGSKGFATARNLIDLGVVDAAIVGGVDSLCQLTLLGFSSLEALSDNHCNPMSVNRDGLNIGESAALFLLSKEDGPVALLGVGESNDAHHISAPDPTGSGAARAMQMALDQVGLVATDIDYVNLHATATPLNDAMESKALATVFGDAQPWSSGTKPVTGHCLGAAGATEAAFLCEALIDDKGRLPLHVWDGMVDPDIPALRLVDKTRASGGNPGRYMMSNSFAFGGNNLCLLLGAAS